MTTFTKAIQIILRLVLFLTVAVYAGFALLSYFDYFERYLYPLHFIQGKTQRLDDNIIIGPYPHFDELKKLRKAAGIDVVISLLNTDLPQEKALYNREQNVAERLGIKLYSYPMTYLGLNGEHNRRTAEAITEFVRGLNGSKIYIHCYLGRHRVNFVKEKLIGSGLVRSGTAREAKVLQPSNN